ncbi:hypothetical protein TruAng_005088 [Truncatella angustata]|nr:hypothetical protein TruAng_005088 [Truncatella angustata]
MAQTPQQRRANEKFAKDQNARRGKSEAERQVRTKQVQKAPISPLWLGKFNRLLLCFPRLPLSPCPSPRPGGASADRNHLAVLLGFVVFGGVFFEVLQRVFWR